MDLIVPPAIATFLTRCAYISVQRVGTFFFFNKKLNMITLIYAYFFFVFGYIIISLKTVVGIYASALYLYTSHVPLLHHMNLT